MGGGLWALGLASALFVLLNGRILGISGIVGGLLRPRAGDIGWRLAFVLGMLVAPGLYWLVVGPTQPRIDANWGMVVIAGLQASYSEETGVKSLKIKHNNVLGYFIEVPAKHADRLMARYKLSDPESLTDDELLAELGRKRGGLMAGGRVNLQKAAEIAINDFRTGAWGRITLESPDEFMQWWGQGQAIEAERREKREKRSRGGK